jgi:hypothetical protein
MLLKAIRLQRRFEQVAEQISKLINKKLNFLIKVK